MAATASSAQEFYQTALVNNLISMAQRVERSMTQALEALLGRDEKLAGEVFLAEPTINEMEIVIDAHAVRLLRRGGLVDQDLRLIVVALKINNDLERIGDLAVSISKCVISLARLPEINPPAELEPMSVAVQAMLGKSLGCLMQRDVALANEVLESDDLVDRYRDRIFEQLLAGMEQDPGRVSPNLYFILATRHLERIADHATNIAEDILFWVRGLEMRHCRAQQVGVGPAPESDPL
jgi:phosphate transport system protein